MGQEANLDFLAAMHWLDETARGQGPRSGGVLGVGLGPWR
jgi:hypothetical protein